MREALNYRTGLISDAERLVETRPDSDKFRLVYFALEIWSLKIVPTG